MADIFTNAGEDIVANLFDGSVAAPASWLAGWGTGAGTAAKADTTLFTEAAEARVAATASQPSSNINQLVSTITSLSAQTITNAGVFDAGAGGNMPLKSDFAGIALGIGDKIEFTFQLTWS